jgi:hypothetical protein
VLAPLVVMLALPIWGARGVSRIPWTELTGTSDPYLLPVLDFALGALVAFVVPVLVIRLVWRQPLREYGLGLGDAGLGWKVVAIGLVIAIPAMWLGSLDPAMREAYPRFGHPDSVPVATFALFALAYGVFFVAQEFAMRGFLLYALEPKGPALAVVVSALVQTLWHLDAPLPELATAPVWGIAAAVLNLRLRSIWPLTFLHWIANVFLDAAIVYF